MEKFLNFIYFTDFYFIEILTSLFSFFSMLISSPHPHPPSCYLELSLFRLQHYHEFSRFFLCGKLYRFRGINFLDLTNFQIQVHHKKPAAIFIVNINCCFSDQRNVGYHTSIFTETKVKFYATFFAFSEFRLHVISTFSRHYITGKKRYFLYVQKF